MKYLLRFLILFYVFGITATCETENELPVIQIITACPQTINTNETTKLNCFATDLDGDSLTYSWSCPKGILQDGINGSSVLWKAPNEPGNYLLNISVVDGQNKATSFINIIVEEQLETNQFIDKRDGNKYGWIEIGEQIWMSENLAYLPKVSPSNAESETEPYYYVYGYQNENTFEAKATFNYITYGVLYNWSAAQLACPDGWHLPTDDEWEKLAQFISDQKGKYDKDQIGNWYNVGKHLKATDCWDWDQNYNIGIGTDDYGFCGRAGGLRVTGPYSHFATIGHLGYWWSSDGSNRYGFGRGLGVGTGLGYVMTGKVNGFSVRCVRD